MKIRSSSGGQRLTIGFQCTGVHGAGAHLLSSGISPRCCRLGWPGAQRGFGLIAGHGQFGGQGAGENLLAWLQPLDWHLLQDLRGLAGIAW
jgi:hypothetical protein